jgi:HlyD family secretion protein
MSTARHQLKKSRLKYSLIGGILLLLGIGGAIVAKRRNADKATVVTIEKALVKTITQIVSATGKIQPEVEVKISPEVSGEIVALPFKEGAAVKKGDLLLSIRPDNYQAQVEQQEAGLLAARATAEQNKAQLSKAREDLERSVTLSARNLIAESEATKTRTDVEVAQASYDSALAQIRRAEGQLKQSRDQLEKTTLYAPINGTVSLLNSERGERVVATGQFAGTEVMRVADLERMEVRVNVNENDVVNVKVGDLARISIDAYPNRKFAGFVKEIASSAKTTGAGSQEEVTNFQVKIRISEPGVALRPGMSANADIETKTAENVVAVPIQSVTVRSRDGAKTIEQLAEDRDRKDRESQGDGAAASVNEKQQSDRERADRLALQRVVFVRSGDTVKQVSVETGIGDTSHIEIKSGLKAGDEVVTGSFSVITRTLKDGSAIRIEQSKTEAAKK